MKIFSSKQSGSLLKRAESLQCHEFFFYPFSMIVISAFVGRRAPDVYGDCKTTCISKFTTSVKQM